LFLVLSFVSLGGLYLLMQAEFIGMVQIIVYAGAIMVLFLFVIMYLNLGRDVESGVQIVLRRGLGWVLGAAVITMGLALAGRRWAAGPDAGIDSLAAASNTHHIGRALFGRYVYPFELVAMVLLAAMIGAIVLAKGRAAPTAPPPSPTAPVTPEDA
jgi:NADH-quinone oxidoreductase subunit J